jgi:hypothetical protein
VRPAAQVAHRAAHRQTAQAHERHAEDCPGVRRSAESCVKHKCRCEEESSPATLAAGRLGSTCELPNRPGLRGIRVGRVAVRPTLAGSGAACRAIRARWVALWSCPGASPTSASRRWGEAVNRGPVGRGAVLISGCLGRRRLVLASRQPARVAARARRRRWRAARDQR